jgi:hypothetical protein
MLIGGICLVVAAVAAWRGWCGRERPLDGAELQLIRRFGDQTRKEQIHPFE